MSEKSEKIATYVDESQKKAIKSAADRNDMTMAAWMRQAAERQLRAERQDEIVENTKAEQRIERLIDQATTEIAQAAEGMHELQAKTGVYTIANFELLKTGFSDPKRQQALSTGSQRLRDDLEALGLDVPEPEPQPADDRDDGDTSARAETRAEEDSDDDRDDGSTTGLFDDE
jgi:transposase-like protein